MSSSSDQVVIPYATFVERRERRRRNAVVLQECDRWELDVRAIAVAMRLEPVVPCSPPLESTGDGRDDS